MTRARRDLDDTLVDSLFDREAAQRLRAEREAMVERHQRRIDEENARAVRRAEEHRRWSRDVNLRMIRKGYADLGVAAPCVDAAGEPTCSVELLMKIGWRVEEAPDGSKTWVRPPDPEPWTGHEDNDSPGRTRPKGRKK